MMPKKKSHLTVHKRYAGDSVVIVHPADSPEGRFQETEMARHLWWNRVDWDTPTAPDVAKWDALCDELKDYWHSRASVALDALRRPA